MLQNKGVTPILASFMISKPYFNVHEAPIVLSKVSS